MSPEGSHFCIKEGPIAELETHVGSLIKTVYGHGNDKGLSAAYLILNETVLIFSKNTRDLTRTVSALVKFHDEFKVKEEERVKYKAELEAARKKLEAEQEKNIKDKRARTTINLTLLAIIVTLIVALVKTVA